MKTKVTPWILALLMLASAFAAWAIQPRTLMADQREKIALAQLIPETFGDWREIKQSSRQIVNPQQTAILEEIYSETLSRTYTNSNGSVVMLSIAYGANQSRDLQIHRPEVCYSAQGFQIISTQKTSLPITGGNVPAMQLVAKQGQRNEPITYWVRIGEKVVRGNIEQGMARLGYGLKGVVADGILFRVSSISPNPKEAYSAQQKFIDDLLSSVPAGTRAYLLGQSSN